MDPLASRRKDHGQVSIITETFLGGGEAFDQGRMSAGFCGRFSVWQGSFYGAEASRCSRACGKSSVPARRNQQQRPLRGLDLVPLDRQDDAEPGKIRGTTGRQDRQKSLTGQLWGSFFVRIRPTIPISPQGGDLRSLRRKSGAMLVSGMPGAGKMRPGRQSSRI